MIDNEIIQDLELWMPPTNQYNKEHLNRQVVR